MKPFTSRSSFAGPLVGVSLAVLAANVQAATYSLAREFSYTDNGPNSTWSYRLDDSATHPPLFPLLTLTDRDANALWGSDFPTPPAMWSDAAGYWGIGKNVTGSEQYSTRNGTRWAPGEVLFHPKAGSDPAGLVVGWTAPARMVIDIHYALGPAAAQGNGIGYQITWRVGGVDTNLVALASIGGGVANSLTGIAVAQGDQLLFRFHTCGDPGGDICRADIVIHGNEPAASETPAIQPSGASITEGSEFTWTAPAADAGPFQWRKDGHLIPDATSASCRIRNVQRGDAGTYSVASGSAISASAVLRVAPALARPELYASPVPRQLFSTTLAEQERELQSSQLMLRLAASRKNLAADRYRPAYHFVSPESQLNDPNGLCFWQGRWHMFYQAYPPDEYPDPADLAKRRQHWGHAVSEDLVHWRDLPYAIYPGLERMCFSGGTVVEPSQVVAFYPGIGAGQMVAVAADPLLLNWTKIKQCPVSSPTGDSCIWKEGDIYFGLVGADNLVSSRDLVTWSSHGAFLDASPFPLGDAGACPSFVPIGDKHILLSFSHTRGGQYLLGDYDRNNHKFRPYAHGRFNHGTVSPGGVHAPSAAADGKGGVINILNINDALPNPDWDQIMSLAQQLTLGPDSQLRIEPVAAVASLRTHHRHVGETLLPANQEILLDAIQGNTLELDVEIDPATARWVQLNVLRSPHADEQTSITFYNFDRRLSTWYDTGAVVCLDASRSSRHPDVWLRPPEQTAVDCGSRDWSTAPTAATPGKPFCLRVFLDRSVVEVFVNRRHYLALRVYPARLDSIGLSLRAQGQSAVLKRLDAWQMHSIWDESAPAAGESPDQAR